MADEEKTQLPARGSGSGPGSVADWFWFIVPQRAEWQHIGNPFNAAMIFAEPTVANTIRVYPITQSAAVRIVCFTGPKDTSCTMKKMEYEKLSEEKDRRDEDLTGRDKVHPVATGVGAVGGGIAGAAAGTALGGPVGTVVGAVVGAVAGGAGGYAIGEAIDPAAEDAYWRENHYSQPFAKRGSYDEYREGYRTGYYGYGKYAPARQTFEEAEPDLRRDYAESKTDLPWEKARDASRAAWDRVQRGEAVRIPISEEQVKVGKRQVDQGSAKVRKEVHTERVNTPIDLKREELVVERSDRGSGQVPGDAFREGEVRIPLKKEEPVVQKDARVVGEVRVGKREETERQNVSETIRKEDVKVDRDR